MPVGYWCPVLHAHLPYVRHPEQPHFLEEDWLFEGLTETYVPIVRVLDRLLADGVEYRLTMTLSPPLVSMMTDELLISRYHRHLDRLIELAGREVSRTRREGGELHDLARFYRHEFEDVKRVFRDVYGSNLLRAFRKHRDAGRLEIITCGATHGFFPLMDPVPEAVRAQVHVAARHHRLHFDRDPVGFWLPECGYLPGHERFLKEVGLRFSFLESHGLSDAHPRPSGGVHAPIVSPGGIVFFGRDMESSRQVWSAESGYPGDFDYREFYKDVGWELPAEYLADFLPDGQRKNLGIKYHRVTGRGVDLAHKQPYVRAWALEKAARHAGNFLFNRQRQVEHLAGGRGQPPIVVTPYDAELFGHWWFEGPDFLDFLFRKMHHDQDVVKPTTPSEYLEWHDELEVCQPPMCTWGAAGYAEVWLNGSNDWIYPHLDMAAERMVEIARRYEQPGALEGRALNQAGRELLLAQSSDWAFIMKTNTTVEYAKKRTRDHIARFDYLYRALTGRVPLEEPILREFEGRDNIFPEIDYRVYR
ncbi:MAG: glycoside hydrolase [Acidobacteria bacterium RBG_16_70_10]|nr:MAG: glycoside hydrolase [Acidobacteria bacterium RBG_16_70_10]